MTFCKKKRKMKKTKVLIYRSVRKLQRRTVSKCWMSWILFVKQRRLYITYVNKMYRMKLMSLFNRWYEYVHVNRPKQRTIIARIVSKIHSRALSVGFTTWKQHYVHEVHANQLNQLHLNQKHQLQQQDQLNRKRNEKRNTKRLQHSINRLLRKKIFYCFRQWIKYKQERKQTRSVMIRVTLKMKRMHLSQGLQTWMKYTVHLISLKEKQLLLVGQLKKIFRNIFVKRILKKGMHVWKRVILLHNKYLLYAKRLQHKVLLSVWNKWNAWTNHCMEVNIKMKRIIFKMTSGQISLAFRNLVENNNVQKSKEQMLMDRNRRMQHVLNRYNNRLSSKSFNKWLFELQSMRQSRKRLEEERLKKLIHAFHSWISCKWYRTLL